MTNYKEYEEGFEDNVEDILKAVEEDETTLLEDLKAELELEVEKPAKKAKSKKKSTAKEFAEQAEEEVEQVAQAVEIVEETKPIEQSVSQTQKKYGWMINERSSKNRRYFLGKGVRH